MARAAAATAARPADRRTLAEELLGIHKKHRTDLERADGIKAELKTIATEQGANFHEIFPGLGQVNAAAAKDATFKGTVPTCVAETFNALTEKQRQRLIDQGVIVLVDEHTRPYYGQVTVKLF